MTFIIKTFNRPQSLLRLLKSIENKYPRNKIIIADDSKKSYKSLVHRKYQNLDINYLELSFDVGLSEGRNIMLQKIETEYFLLLDDDFEFDERTNVADTFEKLKEGNYDILGGEIYNKVYLDTIYSILWCCKNPKRFIDVIRGVESPATYTGYIKEENSKCEIKFNKNKDNFIEGKIYDCDIVPNFFIARTESIKKLGGWQPEYAKVGEHEVFFIRAKRNKLKVGYLCGFGVKHYPKKTLNYNKYRNRNSKLRKEALREIGIKECILRDTVRNVDIQIIT